jgi:hypothetical protein
MRQVQEMVVHWRRSSSKEGMVLPLVRQASEDKDRPEIS